MCYAIPAEIKDIKDDETAVVDYGGVTKEVNLSLVNDPKVGEFVLVHAGFAIEVLDKKSAEESLKIIRKHMELVEEGLSESEKLRPKL